MTRDDFKLGQKVYLKTVSRTPECWRKEKIVEAQVTKIGRNFIHVSTSPYNEIKFSIKDGFRQESIYQSEYDLFLTEEKIYEFWQREYLRVKLRRQLEKRNANDIDALLIAADAFKIPLLDMERRCAFSGK